jgi:radical SAM protein with 4Fe4S-binding SPASM domain
VGNLLEQEFDTIWQNKKARQYRCKEFNHPGCQQCEEFAICNGACPIYWQQIGYDEIIPALEHRGLAKECINET